MKSRIRPLREEDLPQAVQIERTCFSSEAWTEKIYREEFARSANAASAGGLHQILPEEAYLWLWGAVDGRDDRTLLGTISLTRTGDDGEIGNVAVLPSCRRQGIARRLLDTALRFGGEGLGLAAFTLEVRAGNEAAVRLYTSAGFQTEGRRPLFYADPLEDALIMWKRDRKGR